MSKEISELTLKSSPVSTDEIEIQETGGGSSRRTTLQGVINAFITHGTFTPTVQDTSKSDAEGQTYGNQVGVYTKIDDVVYFSITISVASKGTLTAGNQAFIANLPFTSRNSTELYGGVLGVSGQGFSISQYSNVTGEIAPNTDFIGMALWDSTSGVSALLVSEIATGSNIVINGMYFTDE